MPQNMRPRKNLSGSTSGSALPVQGTLDAEALGAGMSVQGGERMGG